MTCPAPEHTASPKGPADTGTPAPAIWNAVVRIWSILWLSGVTPVLRHGKQTPHTVDSLLTLSPADAPERVISDLERFYAKRAHKRWPLRRATVRLIGRSWLKGVGLFILHVLAQTCIPLLMGSLLRATARIQNLNAPDDILLRALPFSPGGQATAVACLMLAISSTAILTVHHAFYALVRGGTHAKVALSGIVFRKCLRLSRQGRRSVTAGHIVNLVSADAARIQLWSWFSYSPVVHGLQITLIVSILLHLLGPASLVGAAVMAFLLSLSVTIGRLNVKIKRRYLKVADERLARVSEALSAIRVIKLYGWDKSVIDTVTGLRNAEVVLLRKLAAVGVAANALFQSTPVLVTSATFSTLAASGSLPPVGDLISAVALFSFLRWAMVSIPESTIGGLETNLALRRIEDFLALPDKPRLPTNGSAPAKGAITCSDVRADWPDGAPALNGLSLTVFPEELVCIVGPVGSGKSALLATLLGELTVTNGTIDTGGRVAYVPQEPWILSGTIRDNIILGGTFDPERYALAREMSQLHSDILHMPEGDETEIGERGLTLSGGQKQRLSLARAAFFDSDIYLLDDPLSALDSKVAARLMDHLICGHWRDKTRILITHRLEFIHRADRVFIMKDGALSPLASFDALDEQALQEPRLGEDSGGASERLGEQSPIAFHREPTGERAKLRVIEEEERRTGSVTFATYKHYLREFSGVLLAAGIVLLCLSRDATSVTTDWWLSSHASRHFENLWTFIPTYLGLAAGVALLSFFRALVVRYRGFRAGTAFHRALLVGVLRAPLRFFEANPVGRILNRFGGDTESADQQIPSTILEVLYSASIVCVTVVMILSVFPWLILLLVPLAVMLYRVQSLFRPTAREVQRLESISRSPVFSLLSESIAGAEVIRAAHLERSFSTMMDTRLTTSTRCMLTSLGTNRWLGIRFELLSAAAVFGVSLALQASALRIPSDISGVVLLYSVVVTGTVGWFVRMLTQLEMGMSSIERLEFFSSTEPEHWDGIVPPPNWPERGEIVLDGLEVRYRPELPPALHHLSLTIPAGEHVGVAGRTGAGKSTLILALCRLIEPSRGDVLIDGMSARSIGLEPLRSALAVIPQDPILFRGSLRRNLDPAGEFSDERLWDAVSRATLEPLIRSLPGGLDCEVAENGANFSVGQRQLVCLARAIVRQNKIVLLDEATAHVDSETDRIIQETIRKQFATCTVITIAHRLSTILDYDRVIILEEGHVLEDGNPAALSADPSSAFAVLLRHGAGSAVSNAAPWSPGVSDTDAL